MPPKKLRSASPATERRERLTLDKLASYDDVATDALVDHAYFWTTTRKNRTKYSPARGIHDDEVGHILLHDVVVAKDIPQAEKKLLELSGLRKYVSNLRSPREKEWFRRHLHKYIQMYHPDCPYEVTTTNRYIITEHEAAICARKFIKANQEIKFLSGTLVAMTKEEELDLGLTRKDFSVVMSSRRKTPSFFLGPARFANHDCDANGRLVTRGTEGMSVMATRNIYEGEEITVSYGEDYFGIDNCECLCSTCEQAGRNGWLPQVDSDSDETTSASTDEATLTEPTARGRKRRRDSEDLDPEDSTSICSTPHKRTKLQSRTSKLRQHISLSELLNEPSPDTELCTTSESEADSAAAAALAADDQHLSKLRQEIIVSERVESNAETPLVATVFSVVGSNQPESKETLILDMKTEPVTPSFNDNNSQTSAPNDCESPSSVAGESHRSSTSSTPTSVDGTGSNEKKKETSETEQPILKVTTIECTSSVSTTKLDVVTYAATQDVQPEISESLESDDVSEETEKTPKARRRRGKWHIISSVEDQAPIVRAPGDYTKTSRLLAQKYDRWVDCQTCDSWFVQSNSYQTRRECPRCERHSKIYGFQWPQTEKGSDGEDRIMDHRIIHRFISPESEARISRRDRGISFGVSSTPELSDARTETATEVVESRRGTRSSRRLARELRLTM
ncbi:Histone-lysine N-methyltransferase set9 [Penicillium taxi]|uniref:Histone-lysine N-methyltransferase set9 n=1 Tax=Penicillium taxi TaxID=168475 RepID=UPI002545708E|nr:Histone-lysine N-methyltransferase set9 [Penicillium taxi]KAJ5888693.1 Histone-lysine N-methyltransferase set9 [Penicillium taxi]